MYKVHGFVDNAMIINKRMSHIPRTGETVRITDKRYCVVTEIIWCLDEDSIEGERVNIRMESEK